MYNVGKPPHGTVQGVATMVIGLERFESSQTRTCSFSHPTELTEPGRLDKAILTDCLHRLTTLSLLATSGDDLEQLWVIEHCPRLKRLELFDMAETFHKNNEFGNIMGRVFNNLQLLEALHVCCLSTEYT